MPKTAKFIKKLQKVYTEYNNASLKVTIGDSLNNHRIPTVNQVIRFLEETGRPTLKQNLKVVYDEVRGSMRLHRRIFNSRTDAYDINEFTAAFLSAYTFREGFNKSLGQRIK